MKRRFLYPVAAVFAVAAGFVVLGVHQSAVERDALVAAQMEQVETVLSEVQDVHQDTMQALEKKEAAAVRQSRTLFAEAVGEADDLIEQADGRVDSKSLQLLVRSHERFVSVGTPYADNIDASAQVVREASADFKSLLSASGVSGEVLPGIEVLDYSFFETARRALDDVGGGAFRLSTADVVCESSTAVGCAGRDGTITIAHRVLGRGYGYLYQLMMHEYAHQVQFASEDRMKASPRYQALFVLDGVDPIEAAADCMAQARTEMPDVGYEYGCSPEQLAWGQGAWQGAW